MQPNANLNQLPTQTQQSRHYQLYWNYLNGWIARRLWTIVANEHKWNQKEKHATQNCNQFSKNCSKWRTVMQKRSQYFLNSFYYLYSWLWIGSHLLLVFPLITSKTSLPPSSSTNALDTIRLNHASRHNHAFGLDSFKVNNIWSNIVMILP